MDPTWESLFEDLSQDIRYEQIEKIIESGDYYPKREDIFRVFRMQISDIRVVILGQDPYKRDQYSTSSYRIKLFSSRGVS